MIETLKNSVGSGLLVAMLLTGCATPPAGTTTEGAVTAAQLKSVWKNQTHEGHPHKIMVLGVAKDPANRRVFEDAFVSELKARGEEAVASHTVLPEGKQNDPAVIGEVIGERGSDTVLVARLVGKQDAQIAAPDTPFRPHIYYDTWVDYFGYGYQALFMPEALADDEAALLETNVYDAANKNMIWSSTSETAMTAADHATVRGAIRATVSAMAEQTLLEKK